MKRFYILAAVLLAFTATACTTPVQKDYPRYLANNAGMINHQRVARSASYYMDKKTQNHRHNVRTLRGGLANKWVVEFGPMLEATMESDDVKKAIANLTKVSAPRNSKGLLIEFSLEKYEFASSRATIDLKITVRNGKRKLLSKSYHAVGRGQAGKMWALGAVGIKNAVQQSTKSAVDQILTTFFRDMKKVV